MQFELHFVLPPQSLTTRNQILDWCVENTPETETGFAGWDTRKYLRQNLRFKIVSVNDIPTPHTFDRGKISLIVEDTLTHCYQTMPWKNTLHVFIYPGYDQFDLDYMDGVGGFSGDKNVFQLFLNPTHPNWEESLAYTVAHEYHHSQYWNYHNFDTVKTGIQAEGLAEHFREELLGGPHAPWAVAIKEDQVDKWIPKVLPELDSGEAYDGIFYGSDDYPMWLGYSLGYWLVKRYREQHPEKTWQELTSMSPEELFK